MISGSIPQSHLSPAITGVGDVDAALRQVRASYLLWKLAPDCTPGYVLQQYLSTLKINEKIARGVIARNLSELKAREIQLLGDQYPRAIQMIHAMGWAAMATMLIKEVKAAQVVTDGANQGQE